MKVAEKLVGAGAIIMALCCAVLPLVGGVIGGGLIASGAGIAGVVAGALVLAAVVGYLVRQRTRVAGARSGPGCGC